MAWFSLFYAKFAKQKSGFLPPLAVVNGQAASLKGCSGLGGSLPHLPCWNHRFRRRRGCGCMTEIFKSLDFALFLLLKYLLM